MFKLKFEYKITLVYLVVGSLWIIFSDRLLQSVIRDVDILTKFQTYKGWFYVFVTAILFFLFLRKHLRYLRTTENELENHKHNLERLVDEKTKTVDIQNAELRSTLKNLEDTQAQLIQAEKMAALGVLTAGVAHEINNPLNYILGGVTGLEKLLGEEVNHNPKANLYIESIKTGVQRAGAIVTGLDQFSRNNATYDEDCNIHEIIENCLTILNGQLKNRVEVIRKFLPAKIITKGNISALHQVFTNIIINSNQAIENKGTITVSTEEKSNMVLIKIIDDGCGIKKEYLDKITDPFFTTHDPGKGTGLGLSMVYNIIQAHKGKITFESVINQGTTVLIQLPIKSFIHE
jgi:signal transduction histidine kinase